MMCKGHRREWNGWLDCSPETFRALSGNAGINIVQIGRVTAVRLREEQAARADRGWAALNFQLKLVESACAAGNLCSDECFHENWDFTGEHDGWQDKVKCNDCPYTWWTD